MFKIALDQFDPSKKLSWNPAYFHAPYKLATETNPPTCKRCVHAICDSEPNNDTGKLKHTWFCGKVVEAVGRLKPIKPDTPRCDAFEAKNKKRAKK